MAVALNNAGTMGFAATNTFSASFSVTLAGSNRCAFAIVVWDNTSGKSITAITYGGINMTACGPAAENATGEEYVQIFYLVNPPTGSNTLAVTATAATRELYVNLVSFTGVSTTPVRPGTYQATTASAKTISQTISSNTNDLTLSARNGGAGNNATTNQTSDSTNGSGSYSGGSDHATTAASSVVHTWTTSSASTNYAMVGFSIQAVGNPPEEDAWVRPTTQIEDLVVSIW